MKILSPEFNAFIKSLPNGFKTFKEVMPEILLLIFVIIYFPLSIILYLPTFGWSYHLSEKLIDKLDSMRFK